MPACNVLAVTVLTAKIQPQSMMPWSIALCEQFNNHDIGKAAF
jgi:hypothetical protein